MRAERSCRFRELSGTFTLDTKAPHKSTATIVVDAASVYTAEKKRDGGTKRNGKKEDG